MMPSMESTTTFNAGLVPDCTRCARRMPAPRNLNAVAAVIIARARALAPYALIELVMPGGSLMAILLWLYRRHKKALVLPG